MCFVPVFAVVVCSWVQLHGAGASVGLSAQHVRLRREHHPAIYARKDGWFCVVVGGSLLGFNTCGRFLCDDRVLAAAVCVFGARR